jgi:hypothetical protein
MQVNATNARAFAEQGSVGSNIIRRVEVWGVDPSYIGTAGGTGVPITMCRDSTGFIYQVLSESTVGAAVPQPGEIWLISRALGLWTFMARISLPSPITQTVTGSYAMQPTNRFIFGAPPSGTTWSITFPNPITATQGEVYGFRNTSGGGTGYTGLLTLAPFGNETIHGPNGFGAHSGASFVVGQDPGNLAWFCIGDTVASGGSTIGGS